MAINGRALTAVGIGSLLIWSGIKGWSILGTAGDLITGKKPAQLESQPLTAGPSEPGGSSVGNALGTRVTGSAIADTALQYQGHAYLFGGAPGKDGSGKWDCSSFTNFVIGVKLGGAIPGYGAGKYNGSSHGPTTGNWAIWPGMRHIKANEVRAGDIIVWAGHMGIATSNTTMISALNPKATTKETPIAGHGNGPLICYGRYGG
jgi:cell wall-associated NlpC family hydrolase